MLSYSQLNAQLKCLVEDSPSLTSALSNAAALLYDSLPNVNWAGFYLVRDQALILGPFGGKPACVQIPFGKGVCGTCAQQRKTIVVADVHQFPGHIACDCASESEIVIPILVNEQLVGVLDIDSPIKDRFTQQDAEGLQEAVSVLASLKQWETFRIL